MLAGVATRRCPVTGDGGRPGDIAASAPPARVMPVLYFFPVNDMLPARRSSLLTCMALPAARWLHSRLSVPKPSSHTSATRAWLPSTRPEPSSALHGREGGPQRHVCWEPRTGLEERSIWQRGARVYSATPAEADGSAQETGTEREGRGPLRPSPTNTLRHAAVAQGVQELARRADAARHRVGVGGLAGGWGDQHFQRKLQMGR